MKRKSIFKIAYTIFITLIVLSFLFTFLAIRNRKVDNSFDDKTIQDFSEGWTVCVDEQGPLQVDLPVSLKSEYNAKVSISKTLPDGLGDFNCMLLESKRQQLHVYVDGQLRASYTDAGQMKIGNSLPSAYLMVPLYNTDRNSEVRIDIVTDTYYSGNISSIYIGSGESIILMLIKSNVIWGVLIAVIAVIGLVCLTCYIMYRNTYSDSIQFLLLTWFGVFTTTWCFSQIKIRQVFVKDLSVAESIGHCCFLLIPFVILLISNYFSDYRHPKFHAFGIIVSIANFLIQNVIHTGFGIDYFELQTITQLFLFWVLTTCIGGCVVDTIKGRMKGRNLVVVGLLGLLCGIVTEAVLTAMKIRYTHLSFYIIGSVVFIVSFTLNTFSDFRRLQKVKDEAENANRAKSLFLATMSHEIRTPINVVLGMNEMILREADSSAIKEYAGNIAEAGKSLLALVNDILDLSKIESGKMDIICVDYYLKSLLNDLIMMTNSRIGGKDIRLIIDIDENIPSKYYGDEVRIREILTNILTNSVKYTESGTITLSIKDVGREEGDILLEFSIKDTGMGMKAENVEMLMSSTFIRFDERKNRNIEGTGLGISITRKLLELMGSELRINSIYGEGSNFHFTLRQQVLDEKPMGLVTEKSDETRAKLSFNFKAKDASVLAVDDTKTNLLVIKGLLKPYEMKVETASSGEECVAKCKENHYDIILMDHMMPEMDGIDTLNVLKNEKLITGSTKVIALTANAITGAQEMYMSHGFDGYLTKPIDVAILDACLRANLPVEKISEIPE